MKKEKITCSHIRRHLCSELDENLNSSRCRAIQKHMKNCPECTAYLKSLKKTIRLYRQYPEVKISRLREDQLLRCLFPADRKKQTRTTLQAKKNPESKTTLRASNR